MRVHIFQSRRFQVIIYVKNCSNHSAMNLFRHNRKAIPAEANLTPPALSVYCRVLVCRHTVIVASVHCTVVFIAFMSALQFLEY